MEKDAVVNNQWILTAEKSGLLRLARMMGLHGAEVMETERLREEIARMKQAGEQIPV